MHNRHQQRDQEAEGFHQSLTTAEQENKAMRNKITALQDALRLATEQLNQFLELRSAFSAGPLREFTCPNCHRQALLHYPSFGQTQHCTQAKTINGQSMQHSSTGLNIDYDIDGGPDAPRTQLGQGQIRQMHGVLAMNRQSSSIDERSCQFTDQGSLAEEIGPAFDFDDAIAALGDIQTDNPRLPSNHLTGDIWDMSPIKSEGSTMQDPCYPTSRDGRLGFAIDQRPEFTIGGFPAPVNGDYLHQRSFAFRPVSAASLCEFNECLPPPPAF
jgi:hypothetical protein